METVVYVCILAMLLVVGPIIALGICRNVRCRECDGKRFVDMAGIHFPCPRCKSKGTK